MWAVSEKVGGKANSWTNGVRCTQVVLIFNHHSTAVTAFFRTKLLVSDRGNEVNRDMTKLCTAMSNPA